MLALLWMTVSGVWVGICDEGLSLGRENSLLGLSQSAGKVWWWMSDGHVWQNTNSPDPPPRARSFLSAQHGRTVAGGEIEERKPIRLRLDCGKKTLSFFQGLDSTDPITTLDGIEGVVFPFVYFDYRSKVELLSTVSEGSKAALWSDSIDSAFIDTGTCVQLLSRIIAVQFVREEEPDLSAHLVQQAFDFAKAVCGMSRRSDRGAHQILEQSGLQSLLGGILAMADRLVGQRATHGDAMAAQLLPQIIDLLAAIQELYDVCPTAMADPAAPIRVVAEAFAAERAIDLRTASYYVWTFAASDGSNLSQATEEFEKDLSNGSVHIPDGFSLPVRYCLLRAHNWSAMLCGMSAAPYVSLTCHDGLSPVIGRRALACENSRHPGWSRRQGALLRAKLYPWPH
jgi:hypothetical protein